MTASDYQTSTDEMLTLVTAAVAAGAVAIVGYVPEVRFQGVEANPSQPPNNRYWFRMSRQTVREGQATLGAAEVSGGRLYETDGILFLQCFGPLNNADVWFKLQQLAELVKDAVRGKKTASGVWFRNERINEIGSDGRFQQINVIAEFQYREIG